MDAVLNYAGGGHCETIVEWVEEAQKLADFVKAEEQKAGGKDCFFGNEHYNVGHLMGLAQHAFILSMYCLLRAGDKPVESFFDYCMYQMVKL